MKLIDLYKPTIETYDINTTINKLSEDKLKSESITTDSTNYTEPKTVDLNYDTTGPFELGLGTEDKTNIVDKSKKIIDYTQKMFEETKTTEFLNENQNRLWFWNYVGFLFAEGIILERENRVIFNEVLEYFNKDNQAFLPNVYKILNYNDPVIKSIEKSYNIDNGNYHFLLIPFVMTNNPEILNKAPEHAYKKYGPIDVFTDINKIVSYMCEAMYKYGTMKNLLTDAISNKLEIPEQRKEDDKYYKHTTRVMNLSSSNPRIHEPMRMNRKGYFDPNTTDNFDLINPEEDITIFAPQRQYFTPGDLKWSDVDKTDAKWTKESNYYRKPAKTIPRESLTNTGNEYGQNVKRNQGKMTLWSQMYGDKKGLNVPAGFVDTSMKGGMLKVNTMYESKTEREKDDDKYQIYDDDKYGTDRLKENAKINERGEIVKGDFIKDSHESVYLDTVPERENIPVWNQMNIAIAEQNLNKNIKMPAEMQGIFATGRNVKF